MRRKCSILLTQNEMKEKKRNKERRNVRGRFHLIDLNLEFALSLFSSFHVSSFQLPVFSFLPPSLPPLFVSCFVVVIVPSLFPFFCFSHRQGQAAGSICENYVQVHSSFLPPFLFPFNPAHPKKSRQVKSVCNPTHNPQPTSLSRPFSPPSVSFSLQPNLDVGREMNNNM